MRLSEQFIDLERHPEEVAAEPDADAEGPPRGQPIPVVAAAALAHNLRRQAGMARRVMRRRWQAPSPRPTDSCGCRPTRWTSRRSLSRQAARHRRAPLTAVAASARSRRHFDVLRVPLDDAKRAAKALGGSVNDLFVAGAAGAPAPTTGPRAKRSTSCASRCRSAPGPTDRPAATPSPPPGCSCRPGHDPAERFAEISARLSVTKEERALGLTEVLAGLVNVLPTSVLVRVARRRSRRSTSPRRTCEGRRWPLYIAGAQIEGNYPLGPVAGTAFNLTTAVLQRQPRHGAARRPRRDRGAGALEGCIEESLRGAPRARLTCGSVTRRRPTVRRPPRPTSAAGGHRAGDRPPRRWRRARGSAPSRDRGRSR